ncbi:hypothetical protein M0R72_17130 [Candidatus Pacearchaeota archaeon]|jgi:hypothetical protein|nr:hypothetical protein [Candidatus Pacearchaeota archaeon]
MAKRYVLIDDDDADPSDLDFEAGPIYDPGSTPPTDDECYISEADALVYFTDDPRATAFVTLSGGIAWYLKRATKNIDALPLRGKKYLRDGTQALQFPREYRDGYDMNESTGVAEVPQNVEDACCEEALAIYLQGTSSRRTLQEQGVKSFSIGGKLQETFADGAKDMYHGLKSADAYRLVSKYIARSFPII